MNTDSIRIRLTVTFFTIGLAVLVFMTAVLPGMSRRTAETVLLKNIEFITGLLADNLALGVQTADLDEGAAVQQALDMLKGDEISSVAVADAAGNLIKGVNATAVRAGGIATVSESVGKLKGLIGRFRTR